MRSKRKEIDEIIRILTWSSENKIYLSRIKVGDVEVEVAAMNSIEDDIWDSIPPDTVINSAPPLDDSTPEQVTAPKDYYDLMRMTKGR